MQMQDNPMNSLTYLQTDDTLRQYHMQIINIQGFQEEYIQTYPKTIKKEKKNNVNTVGRNERLPMVCNIFFLNVNANDL